MAIKVTEEDLQKVLTEVKSELKKALAQESKTLSKADPDSNKPGEESPKAEEAPMESAGDVPPYEAPAPAPEMDAEGVKEPGHEESAEGPEGSEGSIEASASPDDLKSQYESLSHEELERHYFACKSVLLERMGSDEASDEASEESSMMAPEMAEESSMSPEMEAPAMKAEMSPKGKQMPKSPGSGGEIEMSKAEKENDLKLEQLQSQVELLTKAMDLALAQPMRKAITSVAYLQKSEEKAPKMLLSKAEVIAKLNQAASTPTLKKSDRDLINGYCVGSVTLDKIEHLLK